MCVCVCVRTCARARVRVCVCVHVCVHVKFNNLSWTSLFLLVKTPKTNPHVHPGPSPLSSYTLPPGQIQKSTLDITFSVGEDTPKTNPHVHPGHPLPPRTNLTIYPGHHFFCGEFPPPGHIYKYTPGHHLLSSVGVYD